MLAEAPERVKAAAILRESRWWYGGTIVKKVVLFTMEGIADGEAALAFFQSRGAAVEVRDVGRDPEASQDAFRLAGRLAVPTVLLEERVFLGFSAHREEIETLLRE